MIEIDGSHGEGGGAILRVSAALSAVTGKPLHISNIRSGRPKTGLMAQHLHAVKAVANLCQARVDGLEMGSSDLFIYPEKIKAGNFSVDVGTAGSLSLILQSFMIPAFHAPGKVTITVKGGTDVPWSPPIDYLKNVTIPILSLMGCQAQLKVIKRGYYPPGGGIVYLEIKPSKLKPLKLEKLDMDRIYGISHASRLPKHIAARQADAAAKRLESEGYDPIIHIENRKDTLSPGTGVLLWAEGKPGSGRVGGSAMGEKGKPAEIVGREAAGKLIEEINSGAAMDRFMGDQIIPYLALAGSSRVKISRMTSHTHTNLSVASKLTGADFRVEELDDNAAVIYVD